jgi:hypothetical protein
MELVPVIEKNPNKLIHLHDDDKHFENAEVAEVAISAEVKILNPFIEANTTEVSFNSLKKDCIIPVFAKDNEKTISHQEFIEVTQNSVTSVFGDISCQPEIRVSHQIKGRIPEAIHKPVKDLLHLEKTKYYERCGFIIRIPSITGDVNGNLLNLVVGGVRAYNNENLYSKKSIEKFKVFIGFQNMVCCNLCVSTDGFQSEIRASNIYDLQEKITELFSSYNRQKHLYEMNVLSDHSLSEHCKSSKQFGLLAQKNKRHFFIN